MNDNYGDDFIKEIEDDFKARSMGLGDDKILYTIEQAADILGLSEKETTRLISLGEIQAVLVGKKIRVTQESLDNFESALISARPSAEGPILYSAEQVAEILQLSLDNVWKLLKEKRIKGFKIREGRSSWRIPKDALDEFIREKMKKG
jgi:excisionase family DNA binding protein